MSENPPYILSPKTLARGLEKIRAAATPDRFTVEFLSNTLGMKGGTPKPLIPYLKRIGFLNSDGTPTELYKQFRNPSQAGAAAAQALRKGYQALFAKNENTHTLADAELKGLVVEATGLEEGSRAVGAIVASFKVLKECAKFTKSAKDQASENSKETPKESGDEKEQKHTVDRVVSKLGLSYTINLNLPATSDITVFNAIFKSLRENILEQ